MSNTHDALNRFKPLSGQRRQVPPRTDDMAAPPPSKGAEDSARRPAMEAVEDVPLIEVRQTSLRMEAGLLDELQGLARNHNVSREALIEALFRHMTSTHPDELPQVISQAQKLRQLRMREGERKRFMTQLEKFKAGT